MKKVLSICIVIILCALVAVGGVATFVNGDSILKRNKEVSLANPPKNLSIFIDVQENKLYLMSKGKIIKTYSVATGKYNSPSPIGKWIINSKDTWGEGFGGRWMGLNVPWGKYGIHGTKEPWTIGGPDSHGCIRMYNKDVAELYKLVPHGTPVTIYGGPFGAFYKGYRVIKTGDRGADVYEIQRRLKELGYYKGYVSGIYGRELKYAVNKFQRDKKLPVTEYLGAEFYIRLGILLMD